MEDVEAGKVGAIIAKDMSRIGRNYLEVGQYTEIIFPQKGIRFIAIDNGVDSNDPSTSEFAPILNLVNEWYVKDHSEKVRMSYRSRDYAGEHISNMVLYGYRWDPDNKGHWIVDEEAASKGMFGKRVVHGILVSSLISSVLGTKLPGQGTVYLGQELRFRRPVFLNDEITACVEIIELKPEKCIAIFKTTCVNQHGDEVITGTATVMVK
jgi:hypothetical protein